MVIVWTIHYFLGPFDDVTTEFYCIIEIRSVDVEMEHADQLVEY
jgi:hypothetical protein